VQATEGAWTLARKATEQVTTIGIDIGKNTFHLIGLDAEGNIALRRKLSRSQVMVRLANLPPCLIGMEACVGAHHLSRQLQALGHDARLMPAQYVTPFLRGQKNDFRDAEAIAEAVQRPRMRFVPTKSVEHLDLQAIHRVRARLVRHRTAVINQIRALLLERGVAVRQGVRFLRAALPDVLGRHAELLSPRMVRVSICRSGVLRRHAFSHRVVFRRRSDRDFSGCARRLSDGAWRKSILEHWPTGAADQAA
jgi:transposase